MGDELQLDGVVGLVRAPAGVLTADPADRGRPDVADGLFPLLQAAPMFRRAVGGYDRFQVDSYVRWAEDELATGEREREHLVTRLGRTQSALDEATRLLAHSPGGGEFLRLSGRIGSLLAAAADEAESLRGEAQADRAAAAAQVEALIAAGEQVLADAEAEARRTAAEAARVLAEAAAEAERSAEGAARVVAAAEQAGREARAEVEARLEQVRVAEQRAAEDAERTRRRAAEEGTAALLRAREDVVRMLDTARAERRRADAEAAVARERMDRDAAARTACLVADMAAVEAEVAELERRRAALRSEVDLLAGATVRATGDPLEVRLRRLRERFQRRYGSLRAP